LRRVASQGEVPGDAPTSPGLDAADPRDQGADQPRLPAAARSGPTGSHARRADAPRPRSPRADRHHHGLPADPATDRDGRDLRGARGGSSAPLPDDRMPAGQADLDGDEYRGLPVPTGCFFACDRSQGSRMVEDPAPVDDTRGGDDDETGPPADAGTWESRCPD
jgi:hypothetical protein